MVGAVSTEPHRLPLPASVTIDTAQLREIVQPLTPRRSGCRRLPKASAARECDRYSAFPTRWEQENSQPRNRANHSYCACRYICVCVLSPALCCGREKCIARSRHGGSYAASGRGPATLPVCKPSQCNVCTSPVTRVNAYRVFRHGGGLAVYAYFLARGSVGFMGVFTSPKSCRKRKYSPFFTIRPVLLRARAYG